MGVANASCKTDREAEWEGGDHRTVVYFLPLFVIRVLTSEIIAAFFGKQLLEMRLTGRERSWSMMWHFEEKREPIWNAIYHGTVAC